MASRGGGGKRELGSPRSDSRAPPVCEQCASACDSVQGTCCAARNASKLRGGSRKTGRGSHWQASVVRLHPEPASQHPHRSNSTPPRRGKERRARRDGVIAGEVCVTRSRDGTPRLGLSWCPFPPPRPGAHHGGFLTPRAGARNKSSTKARPGPAITPPDKHQQAHPPPIPRPRAHAVSGSAAESVSDPKRRARFINVTAAGATVMGPVLLAGAEQQIELNGTGSH